MVTLNDCTEDAIFIPESHCDDCTGLENRVRQLEQLLEGMQRVQFSKGDTNATLSGYFLGEVSNA